MKGSEIDFDAPHTDYDFMRLDSVLEPEDGYSASEIAALRLIGEGS